MKELAQHLRFAQFYAHNAHNLISGDEFFQDHEFLGDLYGTYESAYDDVVERMIGLGGEPDLGEITCAAAHDAKMAGWNPDPKVCFASIFGIEQHLCDLIDRLIEGASNGTQNFLQGLADESEKRQYKLGQRIKSYGSE